MTLSAGVVTRPLALGARPDAGRRIVAPVAVTAPNGQIRHPPRHHDNEELEPGRRRSAPGSWVGLLVWIVWRFVSRSVTSRRSRDRYPHAGLASLSGRG